mgnify:FL=1
MKRRCDNCTNEETTPLNSCANTVVRIAATGDCFPTGVSSAYSDEYPTALEGLVSRENFMRDVRGINRAITSYWPCGTVYCCSLFLCPCTLGLSLLIQDTMCCIAEAVKAGTKQIDQLNRMPRYASKGITWSLRRQCGKSWIEIVAPSGYSATAEKSKRGAATTEAPKPIVAEAVP